MRRHDGRCNHTVEVHIWRRSRWESGVVGRNTFSGRRLICSVRRDNCCCMGRQVLTVANVSDEVFQMISKVDLEEEAFGPTTPPNKGMQRTRN